MDWLSPSETQESFGNHSNSFWKSDGSSVTAEDVIVKQYRKAALLHTQETLDGISSGVEKSLDFTSSFTTGQPNYSSEEWSSTVDDDDDEKEELEDIRAEEKARLLYTLGIRETETMNSISNTTICTDNASLMEYLDRRSLLERSSNLDGEERTTYSSIALSTDALSSEEMTKEKQEDLVARLMLEVTGIRQNILLEQEARQRNDLSEVETEPDEGQTENPQSVHRKHFFGRLLRKKKEKSSGRH